MVTIVTRAGKGSALTNTELDTNFTNLNTGLTTVSNARTWQASRAYAVGDKIVSPSNRNIVCRVAHTSETSYDARKWTYPGDRNESIVDFTLLPDGNINTIEPTIGCILGHLTPERYSEFGVQNGRLVDFGASTAVMYFTLQLPDTTDKVQHLWAIFDTPADIGASELTGLNISSPERDWSIPNGPNQAGIHHNYIGALTNCQWQFGAYNCPGPVTFSTPATIAAGSNILTVTATPGIIVIGSSLRGLTGGTFNTPFGTPLVNSTRGTPIITKQLSGTTGGVGTYELSLKNTSTSAATASGVNNVQGGPTAVPRTSTGRTIRLDVVADRVTGMCYGFYNGVLASAYPNNAGLQYTSAIGWFEFQGAKACKISQCGISAHLPRFYTNGANALTAITNSDFSLTTITTSWQLTYSFSVLYGESGLIEIDWAPLLNIPAGITVSVDIGTQLKNPDEINVSGDGGKFVFGTPIATGPINSKIPYLAASYGLPGTTQSIGVWIKANGTGATLAANTYMSTGGIRIRAAQTPPAYGIYNENGVIVQNLA